MKQYVDTDGEELTEAQFVGRFTAQCLKLCGFTEFNDGITVLDYCADVASSYYADPFLREVGPEECAISEMEYWGEE